MGYEANRDLKQYLNARWHAAAPEQRRPLAHIIVSDWGGVRANSDDTLAQYVAAIAEERPATPIKGVASYSKIFAIVRPQEFAIYDARVAACLNAVQINAGVGKGLAFNYVPGRNKVVGNSATKKGFTQQPRFSVKSLVSSGWVRIRCNDTYSKYLELLNGCLGLLNGCLGETGSHDLSDLEMALFANAEQECKLALGESNSDCRRRA